MVTYALAFSPCIVIGLLATPFETNIHNSVLHLQFKILSQLGVEAYGVILNQVTSDCKVICSSETVREFVSAEEERGQSVDHNFFRYMCGK